MPSTHAIVDAMGGEKIFRKPIKDITDLQENVRAGLPYRAYEFLVNRLSLGGSEAVAVFHVKKRTLARRKAARVLRADESDRVLRVARVVARAREVLGTDERATAWLKRRNRALGNRVPLEDLDTDIGTRQVEDVLLRLQHGVVG